MSIEDANRTKKRDNVSRTKEKEEAVWNKLLDLSQNVILGMQARYASDMDEDTEGIMIPEKPSGTMNNVVRCSTGARVQQLLNHTLKAKFECIVNWDIGMCSALKNGLLMSQPSPNEVSHFSPHFTPPYHTNKDASAELQL